MASAAVPLPRQLAPPKPTLSMVIPPPVSARVTATAPVAKESPVEGPAEVIEGQLDESRIVGRAVVIYREES
ncbi:hypothetical protein GCM10009557_96630 [Virgisporangium ochraceum]